jgi:RNA polymerase sigma-70 factor (ECF subfamily)
MAPPLPAALVHRLHARAGAGRWGVTESAFGDALARALDRRVAAGAASDAAAAEQFLSGLHLADLALAQACAAGHDGAWRHFLDEIRPALRRAAHAMAGEEGGDLADALYADLFGLEERDGRRRSLFDYYHGRSSLLGWLRSVLSQRWVDRVRAARRDAPLPEEEDAGPALVATPPGEDAAASADAARYVPLLREAVEGAFAALDARERLRLSLYYRQGLTLAAAGRLLGEHEATASRQLERTRRRLREDVERRLTERGLDGAQRARCYDLAVHDWGFDLTAVLPASDPPPGAAGPPVARKEPSRQRSPGRGGAW